MPRSLPALLVLALPPAVAAAPPPAQTLRAAADVLDDLAGAPGNGIPPGLLARAHGAAVFPRVIKAGLVIGGRGGHGVVLGRGPAGAWGDPVFVSLGGASVGLQAGVESADLVLVFKTRRSLDRLFAGKGKITFGADAAAAAGPVGRHAAAATDGKLEAEILTYSRNRGLFAGVSLDGAAIRPDADANAAFARGAGLSGPAAGLRARLEQMSAPAAGPRPALPPPVPVPPVPPPPSAPTWAVPPVVPRSPPAPSGTAAPASPDRVEVALSGLAAAAAGLAYRSARRRVARRWAAA